MLPVPALMGGCPTPLHSACANTLTRAKAPGGRSGSSYARGPGGPLGGGQYY